MGENSRPRVTLRFGAFSVDLGAGQLRKQRHRIKLQQQPFQVLAMFLERPGEAITREEFQKRLWAADTFVDFDHGLNIAINKPQEALGDSTEEPRFIETLPRLGYRFIAPVERADSESEAAATTSAKPAARPRYFLPAVLAGTFILAAAIGLKVGGWRERLLSRTASPRIESLAVLPFQNLSREPEQEYFADGMTEALITELAQITGLKVISRSSAMQYKGVNKPLPQIAKELNVDGVVEGSVLRSGNRVRITVQLIQAPMDRHLWAKSYERDLQDVLVLQDDVAQAIANELKIKLTSHEQLRLTSPRPVDLRLTRPISRGGTTRTKGRRRS